MTFINFQKWIEDAESAPAATSSPPASGSESAAHSKSSSETLAADVAKVPDKLGCMNCNKDFKNWYHTRRKKKIK